MKKNITIIVMTLVVICMGVFVYIDSKKYETKEYLVSNDNKVKDNANVVINDDETKSKDNVVVKVEDKVETKVEEKPVIKTEVKDEIKKETKVEAKEETKKEETIVKGEDNTKTKVEDKVETKEEAKPEVSTIEVKEEIYNEPVSYFLNESKVIESAKTDDDSLKERAKAAFINIVDFIFYDKEIKGYRFSELTSEAKLKIIEIALNIDSKIDAKFPSYKDKIKDGASNIKGKLGVKYLEVSSKICDSMGEYKCNLAKESFNNLKKSFSLTVELVKELAKSGSQKAKEMYENFRG